jgi:hypothetical protein
MRSGESPDHIEREPFTWKGIEREQVLGLVGYPLILRNGEEIECKERDDRGDMIEDEFSPEARAVMHARQLSEAKQLQNK